MGRIIMMTSGKGGVGKTTCAAFIAKGLAARGYEVLLVDGDFGLRDLDLLLGVHDEILYHVEDVWEERCFLEDALISLSPHLSFLGAPQHLRWEDVPRKALGKLLAELKGNYDFIIVDSPAGIGRGWEAILRKADEVLVVAEPNWLSLRDASAVMDRLSQMRFFQYAVLFNKVMPIGNARLSIDQALAALPTERVAGLLPWSNVVYGSSQQENSIMKMEDNAFETLLSYVLDYVEKEEEPDVLALEAALLKAEEAMKAPVEPAPEEKEPETEEAQEQEVATPAAVEPAAEEKHSTWSFRKNLRSLWKWGLRRR